MTDVTPAFSESDGSAAQSPRVLRRTLLRAVVAAVIVAGGVVAMDGLERAFHLTFNKPPMPLSKPLDELAKNLGDPLRYQADPSDSTMPEDQVEVLGTNDYLLRRYVDLSKSPESPVSALHLNLNYYARGSSTPHVPEICWAGAGMKEAAGMRKEFEIPNVRRKDGRLVTLRLTLVSFYAPRSDDTRQLKNVAYLFEVNGEYVGKASEVVDRFWRASNKYAYDTKIEVSVGDDLQFCSQEEAQAAISDFIRAALPEIEKCLPDPNYTPPAPRPAGAAGGKE